MLYTVNTKGFLIDRVDYVNRVADRQFFLNITKVIFNLSIKTEQQFT